MSKIVECSNCSKRYPEIGPERSLVTGRCDMCGFGLIRLDDAPTNKEPETMSLIHTIYELSSIGAGGADGLPPLHSNAGAISRSAAIQLRRLAVVGSHTHAEPINVALAAAHFTAMALDAGASLGECEAALASRARKYLGCALCGCTDIQVSAWVMANTDEVIGGEGPMQGAWCPRCEEPDYEKVGPVNVAKLDPFAG